MLLILLSWSSHTSQMVCYIVRSAVLPDNCNHFASWIQPTPGYQFWIGHWLIYLGQVWRQVMWKSTTVVIWTPWRCVSCILGLQDPHCGRAASRITGQLPVWLAVCLHTVRNYVKDIDSWRNQYNYCICIRPTKTNRDWCLYAPPFEPAQLGKTLSTTLRF